MFRQAHNDSWYPANVPSTVHLDLIENGLLEDPYYRDNLMKTYWVEVLDWEYQSNFTIDNHTLSKQVVELVFEGLDTHTNISLNGETIAQTNNMHRTWIIDVKDKLKSDKVNTLNIYFKSSPMYDLEAAKNFLPFVLPANYSHSRKASYHYGWDWGPRIVTSGIWKPIKIRSYDKVLIDGLLFRNSKIAIQNQSQADIFGFVEAKVSQKGSYTLEIFDIKSQQLIFRDNLNISQFVNEVQKYNFSFKIVNPQLWWTRNLGDPYLYNFQVSIRDQDGNLIDQKTTKYGIRTAEWIQTKDQQGNGTSFGLHLNGIPVFMKGGNYIPPDMFMPRAFKNPKAYNKTIQDAIDANYNMLRLWGGGQYEHDIFYDICDEKGILIWHDMMFACALYPGTPEFLENIARETIDNVKRLRNHPSIAMWNGNNEVLIGWKEWGWQDLYTEEQRVTVFQWYLNIFNETIPNVLNEVDPDRFYWPTSPTQSASHDFDSGDIHMWLVWANQEDIEIYNTHVGRFNSEYGMQGMIPMSSIKQFSIASDWDKQSFVMQLHERHIQGWPNLNFYMDKYYRPTKDFESLVYASMIMQAYAVNTGIEALRRNQPFCMGSLYWQINDVWPVFSWASVDFYGQWKALHYRARKSYEDFTIFIHPNNDSALSNLTVSVVNDHLKNIVGDLYLEILDFNGTQIDRLKRSKIQISSNSRQTYSLRRQSRLNLNFNTTYLRSYFISNNQQNYLFITTQILSRPLNMELPLPNIEISYDYENNEMTLRTTNFGYYIYIYLEDDINLKLSNNFFDLTPGFSEKVKILSYHRLDHIQDILKVKTLYDTYEHNLPQQKRQFLKDALEIYQ
ncbi:beta-mannosidase [Stylonychia lemnae]|uniref:beta-mannosidase n=1 Tax=Stylonychia lemnae TaxID=5949 RepID=A0A078B8U7_STYLE|nr:beta-mannosidase [Stylonychia lemnae]|eukprot:CDW90651.1 beta-mannosidase [Stylonychia lemnae]